MKKTVIAVFLLLMISLAVSASPFASSAMGEPTITVGQATANAGGTVEIPVTVSDNPGFLGFAFTVNYDRTALTLVSASLDSALGGQLYLSQRLIWIGTEDYEGNGTLFTLKFKVSDEASGTYAVSLTYNKGDICNYNEEVVAFKIVAGGVKVGMPGDVNGDGLITIRDLAAMKKLLAGTAEPGEAYESNCDVSEDGMITIKDLAMLKRMLT